MASKGVVHEFLKPEGRLQVKIASSSLSTLLGEKNQDNLTRYFMTGHEITLHHN
jgi:hypothetical protein